MVVGRRGAMPEYEAVIGLEVHAQLKTRSKLFCACSTEYGRPPNSQTCAVCLGHPGALPVLNEGAVELAVRTALALGCSVHRRSIFARKNYFYPDLPKGYQISQNEAPLATGGGVEIELEGRPEPIGLIRLHLEEDAGKSIHDGMPDSDEHSYIDLNRAGVPLVEIVTRPELHEAEEAYLFLQRLRSILRYLDVCDGNLEQGSLRCDANVSIRPRGSTAMGTRTELKNLNSFRNVQRALEFEIARQAELRGSGRQVVQQTVLWDAGAGVTRPMRGKEEARDYRYFPDPDLPPLVLDRTWIEQIRGDIPELPAPRKRRLLTQYGLSEYEAQLLTSEPARADFFEAVARESGNPKSAASFILNDLLREQRNAKRDESGIPLPAIHLARLIRLVDQGKISSTVARRDLFPELCRTGQAPDELVRQSGLEQVSDEAELEQLVRAVLREHPGKVGQYKAGKQGLLGYFVGLVMQASHGRANPRTVNELLRRKLD
jgi:aspartyl-tRNA(Asn)/glutamyl-tRNA(Gln) amidotransferase subunit B